MRYMIIEHFKEGRAGEIYRRFAQKGRMMPAELYYIDSWVSADLRDLLPAHGDRRFWPLRPVDPAVGRFGRI